MYKKIYMVYVKMYNVYEKSSQYIKYEQNY